MLITSLGSSFSSNKKSKIPENVNKKVVIQEDVPDINDDVLMEDSTESPLVIDEEPEKEEDTSEAAEVNSDEQEEDAGDISEESDSSEDTDHLVYDGEIKLDPLMEFHKRVSKKPISWQKFLERINEGDLKFKCKDCGVKYVKIASFVCHALKHTGEKSYWCRLPGCKNAYSNWRALQTHLIFHCDDRKYVCELCGFSCKHRNGYYKHKRVHADRENDSIEKKPRGRGDLEKKMIRAEEEIIEIEAEGKEDGEEEAVFEKEDPKYEELLEFHKSEMKKKSKTWIHMTEVVRVGPCRYRCTVCGKQYRNRKDQIYHVLSHSGERPMKCRVAGCTAGFRNWKKLKDHLVGHCDERKHVCEICGSGFKFRFVLTRHMERHNQDPEKKAKCQYCSATFTRPSDCSAHEKRHKPGEETLTKCDLCDKVFLTTRRFKLQNHLAEEHGVEIEKKNKKPENPLSKCELCEHYFLAARDLRQHLKGEHGVKVIFEKEKEALAGFEGTEVEIESDFIDLKDTLKDLHDVETYEFDEIEGEIVYDRSEGEVIYEVLEVDGV